MNINLSRDIDNTFNIVKVSQRKEYIFFFNKALIRPIYENKKQNQKHTHAGIKQ